MRAIQHHKFSTNLELSSLCDRHTSIIHKGYRSGVLGPTIYDHYNFVYLCDWRWGRLEIDAKFCMIIETS